MSHHIRRREFLEAGAAFATFSVLRSETTAAAPNGKLRTAHVGVGGMGGADDYRDGFDVEELG